MRTATIVGLMALAGTAHAGYITLEPDNYAQGTSVSNVVPGIALSAVMLGYDEALGKDVVISSEPVYAIDSHIPNIGNVLGSAANGSFWSRTDRGALDIGGPGLRVDFALGGAVTSVEFRWSDWECQSVELCFDMPVTQLFDAHDNLIATCNFHTPEPLAAGCTHIPLGYVEGTNNVFRSFYTGYSNPDADIAYAMVGNFQDVDEMRVQVPEPATLSLLGLGILALGLRRRRACQQN